MKAALLAIALAGCADHPDYPDPPVKISARMERGDTIICYDRWFRLGFPSNSSASPAFPVFFGFLHRRFECEVVAPMTVPPLPPSTWVKTR